LAIDRFLSIVEDEVGKVQLQSDPGPQMSWMWRHQSRMSLLSLATQNAYRYWQNTLGNMYPQKSSDRAAITDIPLRACRQRDSPPQSHTDCRRAIRCRRPIPWLEPV
jgi:hypothetical protein